MPEGLLSFNRGRSAASCCRSILRSHVAEAPPEVETRGFAADLRHGAWRHSSFWNWSRPAGCTNPSYDSFRFRAACGRPLSDPSVAMQIMQPRTSFTTTLLAAVAGPCCRAAPRTLLDETSFAAAVDAPGRMSQGSCIAGCTKWAAPESARTPTRKAASQQDHVQFAVAALRRLDVHERPTPLHHDQQDYLHITRNLFHPQPFLKEDCLAPLGVAGT